MLIGLSGVAGSGKDTAADFLINHPKFQDPQALKFVKVGLADPLKRTLKDVYQFTDEQLWGPSHKRNEPDIRYPRPKHEWKVTEDEDPPGYECACCGKKISFLEQATTETAPCYLTPRYALQHLGDNWGRHCYPSTWVDYCLMVVRTIMVPTVAEAFYQAPTGLVWQKSIPARGVLIPDVRYRNELQEIKAAGGKVIRVVRPGAGLGAMGAHQSEKEQQGILDSEFDVVIKNDDNFDAFLEEVREVFYTIGALAD